MIVRWEIDDNPCEIRVSKSDNDILLDYEYKGKYREGGQEIYLTPYAARLLVTLLLQQLEQHEE